MGGKDWEGGIFSQTQACSSLLTPLSSLCDQKVYPSVPQLLCEIKAEVEVHHFILLLLSSTRCRFSPSPMTALSVCSLLFSGAVPNNDPLLQLQLQSAGSLHVAFRNLRESQS